MGGSQRGDSVPAGPAQRWHPDTAPAKGRGQQSEVGWSLGVSGEVGQGVRGSLGVSGVGLRSLGASRGGRTVGEGFLDWGLN